LIDFSFSKVMKLNLEMGKAYQKVVEGDKGKKKRK